tara:strand:+ start:2445 stop:4109 length:1665 start_codon:yes stop_codon:yes gene_type:complete
MESNEQSKEYLVKSNSTVAGPYTLTEIIELISAKKITGFNEVQGKSLHWRLVKDDPIFKVVYQEVIRQMESSEATVDLTSTIGINTQTISDKIRVLEEEATGDLDEIDNYRSSATTIDAHDNKKRNKAKQASYFSLNRFGFSHFLFFLLVSVFIYQAFLVDHKTNVSQSTTNLSLRDMLYIGDYDSVVESLKDKEELSLEDEMRYIEALMQQEKYLQAEREIVEIIKGVKQSDRLAKLKNWLGIIYLNRQDFEAALKNFESSLLLYPNYEMAKLNKIDTLLLLDKSEQAPENLLVEVSTESASSTNMFLKFELDYFLSFSTDKQQEHVKEMLSLNKNVIDQKQELLFLSAFIFLERAQDNVANQLFESALMVSPDFFSENLQSSELYHPQVVLQKLIILFKRQEFKYQRNPYYQAALAMLYFKSNSQIAFREHLDKAFLLAPENPLIQSMASLVEFQYSKAKMTEKIFSGEMTLLEAHKYGKYCTENNLSDCEKKIWDYIMVLNPYSVPAITGKVRQLLAMNQKERAMSLINRGIGLAPRYLPLRKMEMKLKYE